jgi:virginiamycin B lyase
MRVVTGLCLLLAITPAFCEAGAQKKDSKKAVVSGPSGGIKTPGVQIPYASLKSELVFEAAAPVTWIAAADSVWIPSADGLHRIDPKGKESKFGEPVAGLKKPCAGLVNAFGSLWVPACDGGTIARIDAKTSKVTATLPVGTGAARPGIAATADSVWTFTDSRGTLSRIDPVQNVVVAEFRVYADCNTLVFGETALWLTCPSENKVLRVDPATNLVEKAIEVSARPVGLAIGETSVWVLCEKEGKIDRIDPKTNKVTKTIELGAPAVAATMSIGEGSLWVSMSGFPVTRVDPGTEKVVQQFWGDGAGVIQAAMGSVWLADGKKVAKLDPKRVGATLAE